MVSSREAIPEVTAFRLPGESVSSALEHDEGARRLLVAVADILNSTRDVDAACAATLEALSRFAAADRAFVILWDLLNPVFTIRAAAGLPRDVVGQVVPAETVYQVAGQEHRALVLPPDREPVLLGAAAEACRAAGVDVGAGSMLAVPLRAGNMLLGLLAASRSLAGGSFTEGEIPLLSAVGDQLAVCLFRNMTFRLARRTFAPVAADALRHDVYEAAPLLKSALELIGPHLSLPVRQWDGVWLRDHGQRLYHLVAGPLRSGRRRRAIQHLITQDLLAEVCAGRVAKTVPFAPPADDTDRRTSGETPSSQPTHLILMPVQLPYDGEAVFCFASHVRGLTTDLQLLRAFKLELEIILRNAESHRAAAARALLIERAGIGMELHDGLAQSLFSLQLQLAELRTHIPETAESARAKLDALTLELAQAQHELRNAISGLRYALPEGCNLDTAIRRYVGDFSEKFNITATFRRTGRRWQPFRDVEVHLFRVVQELLTNVRKHAAATAVQVHLHVGARELRLTVTDNGKGFDPSREIRDTTEHFGLTGIRHRVEQFGGSLSIRTPECGGTEAMVVIPLTRSPEQT
jgi:signal transduction histidine kinase